ncbi:hypothetical protein MSAN_02036600 [Mycena sanguinolenta]|uniref:Uncharacterized protein n=1 Tax=Mycena sanguinolenta TaxID=230812 RepID=A0A8H7CMU6_9AGAR|nr:hypothetical protein MSAN_02036600 [Mycena sanguinolenta]
MFTFDVTTLMTPEAAPIHSYVDRLAPDGRSIVRDAVRVEPPSPLKRARLGERTEAAAGESSDQQDAMDDHDRYEMSPDLEDEDPPVPPLPRLPRVLNPKRLEPSVINFDCQEEYSLNLVPGSGQTDGEGIERPWASTSAPSPTSTRVSGPGARHDALDDHWNFWNWLKTISLRECQHCQVLISCVNMATAAILRRRLDAARKEQASQRQAFELFSLQQAVQVPEWKRIVEEYEADNTQKNPGLTEAEVKLQFATEEEEEAKKGFPALHEVSRSGFITAGLELEDQQRRTRVQAELKKAGTTAMVINMKSLRAKLNRGIAKFRILQTTYTPAAIQALAKRVTPVDELPEDIPLMLPSALTEAERDGGGLCEGAG